MRGTPPSSSFKGKGEGSGTAGTQDQIWCAVPWRLDGASFSSQCPPNSPALAVNFFQVEFPEQLISRQEAFEHAAGVCVWGREVCVCWGTQWTWSPGEGLLFPTPQETNKKAHLKATWTKGLSAVSRKAPQHILASAQDASCLSSGWPQLPFYFPFTVFILPLL